MTRGIQEAGFAIRVLRAQLRGNSRTVMFQEVHSCLNLQYFIY
jgi:hypothetical protein